MCVWRVPDEPGVHLISLIKTEWRESVNNREKKRPNKRAYEGKFVTWEPSSELLALPLLSCELLPLEPFIVLCIVLFVSGYITNF